MFCAATGNVPQGGLRRGKSLLGRDEEIGKAGLFKCTNNTLRRKQTMSAQGGPTPNLDEPQEKTPGCFENIGPGPKDWWFIYSYLITCCVPRFLLSSCGIRTPEQQQRAWCKKISLLTTIMSLMASVGFITFGFTRTVCGKPAPHVAAYTIGNSSLIIHGYAYDLADWKHPKIAPYFNGTTSPLYTDLVTVRFIDTSSIGCVASEVVLYVSLVFIIGVVSVKFAMAVIFGWFLSWRLGSFGKETYAERMQCSQAIESWTDDIYRPAPGAYRPNANQDTWGPAAKDKNKFLPSTSRFSPAEGVNGAPG
ncbi:Chitin synthase, class 3 [Ceratobasidium sp. UAMH 11750]|nr:Chitin synthase, class 3 [Ceratobasidium sp. UAMH 11750]